MKFVAKTTDLKLELTTLTGEEIVKDASQSLSANKAAMILKKINDSDSEIRKKHDNDPSKAMHAMCIIFEDIYGTESEWWEDNLDSGTLIAAKNWIIFQLMGVKKNG